MSLEIVSCSSCYFIFNFLNAFAFIMFIYCDVFMLCIFVAVLWIFFTLVFLLFLGCQWMDCIFYLSDVFNCVEVCAIINVVHSNPTSFDQGLKYCMFVLCWMVTCVVYNSNCGMVFCIYLDLFVMVIWRKFFFF